MNALARVETDTAIAVSNMVASLPALVQRAAAQLAAATSAAEVLDAKAAAGFAYDAAKATARFAKAKGAFDEIQSAVYRAQADALEIEAMAKRRFADELDAAQERGEIATKGGNGNNQSKVGNIPAKNISTFADVGITAQQAFDARQVRDAENNNPGVVRGVLDDIVASGSEPTRAELTRQLTATRLNSFSGDNEWYTPAKYIEMAREVLGEINTDPASNDFAQQQVKAATYYTITNSGLDKEWNGRVWMNPPYSNPEIGDFTDKLIAELEAGHVTGAVVLTNNSGDTAWHHTLANASNAMCVTRGRIKFESTTRTSNSPAMGQSFFYFGDDPDLFASVFRDIGRISKSYWA